MNHHNIRHIHIIKISALLRNICPEKCVCLEREFKITENNIRARKKYHCNYIPIANVCFLFLQQTDKTAEDKPLIDSNLDNVLNDREILKTTTINKKKTSFID